MPAARSGTVLEETMFQNGGPGFKKTVMIAVMRICVHTTACIINTLQKRLVQIPTADAAADGSSP